MSAWWWPSEVFLPSQQTNRTRTLYQSIAQRIHTLSIYTGIAIDLKVFTYIYIYIPLDDGLLYVCLCVMCLWTRAFASRRGSIIGFAKLQGGDCTFEVIALSKRCEFSGVWRGELNVFFLPSPCALSRDFMIRTRDAIAMGNYVNTHTIWRICTPMCSRSRCSFHASRT